MKYSVIFTERSLACFLLLWIFVGVPDANAQDKQAGILKVVSTTEDRLEIQIASRKAKYERGENIIIDYSVKNNGKKPIYLAVSNPPKIKALRDSQLIEVLTPIEYPDKFGRFSVTLKQIQPKKRLEGQLVLDGSKIEVNENYAGEDWSIQIGFAYLFDASPFTGCEDMRSDLVCLSDLYEKSKSLTLGHLVIYVSYH